ncbi:MAG: tetratricopeptide repeat protein, partial [Ginsengibacter sp.]
EMNGQLEDASDYYDKAIKHTTNPLLDIHANLNKAKMLRSNDPGEITRSINQLVKMSKKYKFEPYKDVIFNSAGQLALEIPDTLSAISFFKASTFFSTNNIPLKNQSFLQLAEISYLQKNYKNAYAYYDSIKINDPILKNMDQIKQRKEALSKIVKYILIIEREDSLQAIAALSSVDRDALIKKLSKKLQKERGITDEEMDYTNSSSAFFDAKNASGDIFYNNNASGDWYFYNTSVKEKGLLDFKRNWGKRDNVDNWRRIKSGGNNSIFSPKGNENQVLTPKKRPPSNYIADPMVENVQEEGLDENDFLSNNKSNTQEDISVDGLLANVPLTKSKMDSSNTKISISLFQLGKNYQNLLEDYRAAIHTYEESLKRFPDSLYHGELYLNLSYCYLKIGEIAKADFFKKQLLNNYKDSKFADYLLHPEKFNPTKNNAAATQRYEKIYNLFIEGNFKEAFDEKHKADSVYGNTFWNPQLLYIEAVYHVQKKEDSIAINVLNQIISLYPKDPLMEKSAIMIDVLKRRKSIENYLTNLEIKRVEEAPELSVFDDTKIEKETQKEKTQPKVILPKKEEKVITQKVEINPEKQKPAPISDATFSFDAFQPQYVMMVLDKVDPVYINEAKNAFTRYNSENFYSSKLEIIRDTLNSEKTILLFSPFVAAETAITFLDRIKKDAPREISWLPANKYSFLIISAANLELLKSNQKLQDYINLLNQKYPNKF